MSRASKTSVKSKKSKSESPSRETPGAVKKNDEAGESFTPIKQSEGIDGVTPLPPTPPEHAEGAEGGTASDLPKTSSSPALAPSAASAASGAEPPDTPSTPVPSAVSQASGAPSEAKSNTSAASQPGSGKKTKDKKGNATPRSKSHRAEMKFGERPSTIQGQPSSIQDDSTSTDRSFDTSKFQKMTAIYFHKNNDLSKSARGVGYTPDQAVSKYGPGVNAEAESIYGPCRLLSDFQYSTWTETVVPLKNHNVVQGFNEMMLFLMKLAANSDGPVNHEEAFMATSFLANIRNDLGEHPPNVLALLEYIDFLTHDDGTEHASPDLEVIPPCKAAERY